MATHWTLGCDADDPQRIAAFWAQALRYVPEPGFDGPDNASIVDPQGRGPAIGFLRVPEGKTAKNRVHIDIRVAGEPPWDPVERDRLVHERVAELEAAALYPGRAAAPAMPQSMAQPASQPASPLPPAPPGYRGDLLPALPATFTTALAVWKPQGK